MEDGGGAAVLSGCSWRSGMRGGDHVSLIEGGGSYRGGAFLWRRRKCLYTCSVGEGSLGTGHQRRQADQGQGWAGPEGRRLLGRVEVAAWRGNGGGPAGENGLGLIGQPGQKYSRIRKRI